MQRSNIFETLTLALVKDGQRRQGYDFREDAIRAEPADLNVTAGR